MKNVTQNKQLVALSRELQILNYNQLNVSAERAKIIVKGYLSPIREMPKDDIVKSVGAMISLCAQMYCGMQPQKMLVETIQESVRLVYKHYSSLGVEEIREAFSMAAANHFDGVNMTAFFGTFTISMLGDILTAYINYRNPVIAKITDIAAEEERKKSEELLKEEKNREARQKIYDDIEKAIIGVQSGTPVWETWHDVPVHYAEIAVKEGWIEVDSEFKKRVWEEAKKLAEQELRSAADDLTNFSEAKKARLALRNKLESEIITDPARRIYSKLLIFEYVKMHEL